MADRYLIGTGARTWNNPAIWSLTSGGAPYQPASGVEKITNGTFDNSTGWNLNSGLTISGGKLNYDGLADNKIASTSFSGTWNVGKWYKYTIVISSGTGYISLANGTGGQLGSGSYTLMSTGSYTIYFIALAATQLQVVFRNIGGGGACSIESLSVQEVDTIAPDSVTNAIIDQNSGTGTITIGSNTDCLNLDMGAANQSFTLANSAYQFNIYGNLNLSSLAIISFTGTGYLYIRASCNITTNGCICNFNRLYIQAGINIVKHIDDYNASGYGCSIYIFGSVWDTNNKIINVPYNGIITDNTGGNRVFYFGSSTINCGAINFNYPSTLTLNAGTSTINTTYSFRGAGKTYYNVNITPRDAFYDIQVIDVNIFNNLTINSYTNKNSYLNLSNDQIVNSSFNISGVNSYTRILVHSSVIGTPRTITCNGTISASNVDFRDIFLAGTCNKDLSGITGGSGDCGGNSGITFTTAQPQYFKKYASTANYGDAANWFSDLALTVAGRVPLPQDLGSKFLATSFDRTCTVTCNVPRIPCLDMSEVVNAVTWTLANTIFIHGGFRYNSTYVTIAGNFLITCDIHGKTVQNPLYLGVATGFANNFDVILSNTIAELIIDSGRKVRFAAGTTQTIAKATIGANVTLDCVTASTYTLALNDITTAENINIKGCIAPVSKLFAEANSVDSGSNTNVVFGDYFTPIVTIIENRNL